MCLHKAIPIILSDIMTTKIQKIMRAFDVIEILEFYPYAPRVKGLISKKGIIHI